MSRSWFTLAAIALGCVGGQAPQPEQPRALAASASPTVPLDRHEADFQDAVRIVESALGSKAQPLALQDGKSVSTGRMFETPDALTWVTDLHDKVVAKGASLFVLEVGESEKMGLLPTTEKYEVIRVVGTNGNSAHSHEEVVAWLKDLDRTDPWQLLGAGVDFVEGWFVEPVRDPHALAQNVLSFCPDFYYQGIGLDPANQGTPLEVTERHFRTERLFFFWWD